MYAIVHWAPQDGWWMENLQGYNGPTFVFVTSASRILVYEKQGANKVRSYHL